MLCAFCLTLMTKASFLLIWQRYEACKWNNIPLCCYMQNRVRKHIPFHSLFIKMAQSQWQKELAILILQFSNKLPRHVHFPPLGRCPSRISKLSMVNESTVSLTQEYSLLLSPLQPSGGPASFWAPPVPGILSPPASWCFNLPASSVSSLSAWLSWAKSSWCNGQLKFTFYRNVMIFILHSSMTGKSTCRLLEERVGLHLVRTETHLVSFTPPVFWVNPDTIVRLPSYCLWGLK